MEANTNLETPAPPADETTLAQARHHGKISRLPKVIRDQINLMIQDGLPYSDIIEKLGAHGKGLNLMNLSRWKAGGYKDWLVEQSFIERMRARRETPRELAQDCDATEVSHAALQLGTLQMFEALRDLGPGSLDEKLGGDTAAFVRLINALARASRETMQLQKYREACLQARAALRELRDPDRKLTESERHSLILKVDELLGFAGKPNPLGIATIRLEAAPISAPAPMSASGDAPAAAPSPAPSAPAPEPASPAPAPEPAPPDPILAGSWS